MGFGADSVMLEPTLRRLLGAPDQLVSVTRAVLDEGPGRGSPILTVRNPAGISFDLLLDRAMDIGWADAAGLPLAWRSARGPINSARYKSGSTGWVHTFGGGLLTTCGLASTGAPSTVDGVHHPLHGRVGHIPAENVRWSLVDDDGVLSLEVTGDVIEAALGTPTLALRRRLVASTAEPMLRIEDTVRNPGWVPAGHMFRHHVNLGAPVVVPGTVVTATADPVGERDRSGPTTVPLPWTLDIADGTAPEVVLHCRPHPGPVAAVEVRSPHGAWVRVEQDTASWDQLVLWRDATPGVNVLGVEPSTSRDFGRKQAEHDGEVIWLEPGQERSYRTVVRAGR
ncbi:DUF4432 family protein [Georgenia yuyongxinii]|uniref:DUF4432 family protein n=2 Tax=Georgenia yuyongxinii TaxID=2589797 RepID=A0A5B8C7F4_9MICO|nr:DUF4432 family protein [Georgenia yuyongxinii]